MMKLEENLVLAGASLEDELYKREAMPLFSSIFAYWYSKSIGKDDKNGALYLNNFARIPTTKSIPYPQFYAKIFLDRLGKLRHKDDPDKFISWMSTKVEESESKLKKLIRDTEKQEGFKRLYKEVVYLI
jgi:hypothetical protein